MILEIGAYFYTQNLAFDTKSILLKSCGTIEKSEDQTSEAVTHVKFKNVIYLFLTTSGWT